MEVIESPLVVQSNLVDKVASLNARIRDLSDRYSHVCAWKLDSPSRDCFRRDMLHLNRRGNARLRAALERLMIVLDDS